MPRKHSRRFPVLQVAILVVLSAALATVIRSRTALPEKPAEVLPSHPIAEPVSAEDPEGSPSGFTPAPAQTPDTRPETTPTPAPTPEPEPEYFTISMVGDCTLAEAKTRRGWGTAYQSVVGNNYSYPFAKTVDRFPKTT